MNTKVVFASGQNLSSRVEHIWHYVMHQNGWKDFCESTTQFHCISYAYTKDAPKECITYGQELWSELIERFTGSVEGEASITLSREPMGCVTRRWELWDK